LPEEEKTERKKERERERERERKKGAREGPEFTAGCLNELVLPIKI